LQHFFFEHPKNLSIYLASGWMTFRVNKRFTSFFRSLSVFATFPSYPRYYPVVISVTPVLLEDEELVFLLTEALGCDGRVIPLFSHFLSWLLKRSFDAESPFLFVPSLTI